MPPVILPCPETAGVAGAVAGSALPRPLLCFLLREQQEEDDALPSWPGGPHLPADPTRQPLHTLSVGLGASQTQERFELWGACEELDLPSLPTRRSHGLA
jgi:hypothetical protein